ncbi:hypothetical protein pipiens_002460 [Culex pipiens pipiens]|uniref:Cytochrome P450 n=1 Tax=Culex pipiens pipiens TaxID=38569 RepID=A0ABD1DE38_CULPP
MFMAYELALNQDIQQKLYKEKMTYMDMVVSESLRMWPVPLIDRLCVRDYSFDEGEGLKFTIEKGACLWFPVHGIHHDAKYYPDPSKFDPERFSEANKGQINTSAYLPFGVGPRNCIRSRLALMKIKAIMYQLMLDFKFERTEKTQDRYS